MKKVVLKMDMHDERIKQKAMEQVSGLAGVESVSVDAKEKKITVIGNVDAVTMAKKLRKICPTAVESLGPAEEGEKISEEEKDDKTDHEKAYETWTQTHQQALMMPGHHNAHIVYNPYAMQHIGDNPNSCSIS